VNSEVDSGFAAPATRSTEDMAALKLTIAERQRKIAEEQAATAAAEDRDWQAELIDRPRRELAAWAGLPCLGQLEAVAKCGDAFEATCERREHGMCARRQLARAIRQRTAERAQARAGALVRGVPLIAIEAVYDKEPIRTNAMDVVAAWNGLTTFLVMSGGVGCGKTGASSLWAVNQGAVFITAKAFGSMSPYSDDARAVVLAKRLVLDDLGAEYADAKGFFLANLDALIDHRYAQRLGTIITTNLGSQAFKAYGDRVLDRLRESGSFKQVFGKSLRGKS